MIPSHVTDRLREADVPSLVSQYVRLRRAGQGRQQGLCPFHKERTASFTVWSDHYHCFGCGASGNAVGFLMAIEGMPYPEAARLLADRMGIWVEDKPVTREQERRAREEAEFGKWWCVVREAQLRAVVYDALQEEDYEFAECVGRLLRNWLSLTPSEWWEIFRKQATVKDRKEWEDEVMREREVEKGWDGVRA